MPNDQNSSNQHDRKDNEHGEETKRGGSHADHLRAGRAGGQAVSKDRKHMAEIGRKGGEAVSENRAHMAEIGRKGGEARGRKSAGKKANA